MPGLFSTPIPPQKLDVRWNAREVVVDLRERPHLLQRVTVTGPLFPLRDAEPWMTIGETRSRFVKIAPDGGRADAYFDADAPLEGEIRFGHGDDLELIIPRRLTTADVKRLDRKRLPKGTLLRYEKGHEPSAHRAE